MALEDAYRLDLSPPAWTDLSQVAPQHPCGPACGADAGNARAPVRSLSRAPPRTRTRWPGVVGPGSGRVLAEADAARLNRRLSGEQPPTKPLTRRVRVADRGGSAGDVPAGPRGDGGRAALRLRRLRQRRCARAAPGGRRPGDALPAPKRVPERAPPAASTCARAPPVSTMRARARTHTHTHTHTYSRAGQQPFPLRHGGGGLGRPQRARAGRPARPLSRTVTARRRALQGHAAPASFAHVGAGARSRAHGAVTEVGRRRGWRRRRGTSTAWLRWAGICSSSAATSTTVCARVLVRVSKKWERQCGVCGAGSGVVCALACVLACVRAFVYAVCLCVCALARARV